jgi:hypothetical protein
MTSLWKAPAEISEAQLEQEEKRRAIADKAIQTREDFLDDAVAGLMASGVCQDQISVHYYSDLKVTIEVDGVEKYCHQIEIDGDSENK